MILKIYCRVSYFTCRGSRLVQPARVGARPSENRMVLLSCTPESGLSARLGTSLCMQGDVACCVLAPLICVTSTTVHAHCTRFCSLLFGRQTTVLSYKSQFLNLYISKLINVICSTQLGHMLCHVLMQQGRSETSRDMN